MYFLTHIVSHSVLGRASFTSVDWLCLILWKKNTHFTTDFRHLRERWVPSRSCGSHPEVDHESPWKCQKRLVRLKTWLSFYGFLIGHPEKFDGWFWWFMSLSSLFLLKSCYLWGISWYIPFSKTPMWVYVPLHSWTYASESESLTKTWAIAVLRFQHHSPKSPASNPKHEVFPGQLCLITQLHFLNRCLHFLPSTRVDAPSCANYSWMISRIKTLECHCDIRLSHCDIRMNMNELIIVSNLFPGWWFQTFFIFHNIWDNPSHWLIFFKMVKTTNQFLIPRFLKRVCSWKAVLFSKSAVNCRCLLQVLRPWRIASELMWRNLSRLDQQKE